MYLTLIIVIVSHSIAFTFLTISLVVNAESGVPVCLMTTKNNDKHALIIDMKHMPMYVFLMTTVGTTTMK